MSRCKSENCKVLVIDTKDGKVKTMKELIGCPCYGNNGRGFNITSVYE